MAQLLHGSATTTARTKVQLGGASESPGYNQEMTDIHVAIVNCYSASLR